MTPRSRFTAAAAALLLSSPLAAAQDIRAVPSPHAPKAIGP